MIGYNTEAELTDYATARGITLTGSTSVLLTKALDWVEVQPFKGVKASASQPLEWPRDGVYVDGEELSESTVPEAIETAQLVAAILIDGGEDLFATIGPRVTMEKVGPIAVSYSDKGNQANLYPQLSRLLADYLKSSGMSFAVTRA